MNHFTPMYCHSCSNLQRSHDPRGVEHCNQHHQPAVHIVSHCINVGGKVERWNNVLFKPREAS